MAELDLLFRECFVHIQEWHDEPVVLVIQGPTDNPEKQRLISIVREDSPHLFIDYKALLAKVEQCIIGDDRLRRPKVSIES
ncbi:MAG: hypothetical protein ACFFCQ_03520 [Promethearchaeota archaeon]